MKRRPERTLERRLGNGLGGLVRQRVKNGAGAVRMAGEQDWQCVFHRGDAEIILSRMTVDPVEKRGEIEQLVACVDELEVKKLLLVLHGGRLGPQSPAVNR